MTLISVVALHFVFCLGKFISAVFIPHADSVHVKHVDFDSRADWETTLPIQKTQNWCRIKARRQQTSPICCEISCRAGKLQLDNFG